MSVRLKKLSDQVMVITGASSGIGLCTARMAARKGASLVLAARNAKVLEEVCQDIRSTGGSAVWVECDVSNRADVDRVAATALEAFGRIDTWVNNAGVSIFGPMEQVSEADHRQLFEINFWGVVHGSLTAVKHLRRGGGALINVGSVVSDRAFPLQGMYCASKHAVKGFTDALRMELEHEGAPISVTLIKPTAIATPFMEHAKNYTDREFQLPPPIYKPEEVAKSILQAATHQHRDILVGSAAAMFSSWSAIAPRSLDKVAETFLFQAQKKDDPATQLEGNLYRSLSEGKERPDHPGYPVQASLYNKAKRKPLLAAGMVAALGLAASSMLKPSSNARKLPSEPSS